MTKRPPKNYGVNEAIRKAGYVRLPPWWVTPDELEVIHRMAHNHRQDITRLRLKARGVNSGEHEDET